MNKEKLDHFKKKLEWERKEIEIQLRNVVQPSAEYKGEWQPDYPKSCEETGHEVLEADASNIDQYTTNIAVTQALTRRSDEINRALEKIKKGIYGRCENCDKEILLERLEANPAARECFDCAQ